MTRATTASLFSLVIHGAILSYFSVAFAQSAKPTRNEGIRNANSLQPANTAAEAQLATELVQKLVGLSGTEASEVIHNPPSVHKDATPFLHSEFIRRATRCLRFDNVSLRLPSAPTLVDSYARTLNVYLDPSTGQLLKVATTWPATEPPIAPELDPEVATEQLRLVQEIYHGFPEDAPPISFLEALDIVKNYGGNPLAAKQIMGVWTVWSKLEKEPAPMWIITLRGIPPIRPYRNVPPDSLNHMRYVVDPVKKKCIYATTRPQPDAPERNAGQNPKPEREP